VLTPGLPNRPTKQAQAPISLCCTACAEHCFFRPEYISVATRQHGRGWQNPETSSRGAPQFPVVLKRIASTYPTRSLAHFCRSLLAPYACRWILEHITPSARVVSTHAQVTMALSAGAELRPIFEKRSCIVSLRVFDSCSLLLSPCPIPLCLLILFRRLPQPSDESHKLFHLTAVNFEQKLAVGCKWLA